MWLPIHDLKREDGLVVVAGFNRGDCDTQILPAFLCAEASGYALVLRSFDTSEILKRSVYTHFYLLPKEGPKT